MKIGVKKIEFGAKIVLTQLKKERPTLSVIGSTPVGKYPVNNVKQPIRSYYPVLNNII